MSTTGTPFGSVNSLKTTFPKFTSQDWDELLKECRDKSENPDFSLMVDSKHLATTVEPVCERIKLLTKQMHNGTAGSMPPGMRWVLSHWQPSRHYTNEQMAAVEEPTIDLEAALPALQVPSPVDDITSAITQVYKSLGSLHKAFSTFSTMDGKPHPAAELMKVVVEQAVLRSFGQKPDETKFPSRDTLESAASERLWGDRDARSSLKSLLRGTAAVAPIFGASAWYSLAKRNIN